MNLKMKKTNTAPTIRANCQMQFRAGLNRLSMDELELLCDDPARNESGQEVQAVLTPHKLGFVLSVRDGEVVYEIIDGRGRQITYRTIDLALNRLSDVPHLLSDIVIDTGRHGLSH